MPRRVIRYNTRRRNQQLISRSRSFNIRLRSATEPPPGDTLPLPRLRSQAQRLQVVRQLEENNDTEDESSDTEEESISSSATIAQSNEGVISVSEDSEEDLTPREALLRLPPHFRENAYIFSDGSDDELFEGFGDDDDDDDIGMDRFAEVIVYLESGDLLNHIGTSASLADDCLSDDGDLPDDPFQREMRGSVPEPSMSLHAAALRGNTKELQRWRNWKIGHCGKKARLDTPLHCAARAGDVGTVEELLEQGASINATNMFHHSPLEIAARHGHTEVVKTLLKHGAAVDPDEMDRAFEATKSWAVVEALRAQDPVNLKELPPEQMDKIAPWVNQMLFRVVQKGRVNMLRGLLDLGANVNCNGILGWTPLQIAVRRGHIRCVTALLEGGADVNGRDDFKWTALHYAAREGHHDIALLLLKGGADISAKCRTGRTPLAITSDEATRHLLENYQNV